MSQESEGEATSRIWPRTAIIVIVGVISGGVAFYLWLLRQADLDVAVWGQRGDAVAPITATLTAFALFSALFSVHTQRRELALQRQELKLQRQELKLQRQEMADGRRVQEAQQEAQDRLANAQNRANELTVELIRAQKIGALATLRSGWATTKAAAPGSRGAEGIINLEIKRLLTDLGIQDVYEEYKVAEAQRAAMARQSAKTSVEP